MKISNTTKLNARSWSLQAVTNCPGSKENGKLVPACSGCYATTGYYRMPNAINARNHNAEDWKRDSWVNDMVTEIQNDKLFRWFDSGDMYHINLAKKILQIMKATPNTRHWMPTRMAKFPKFQKIIKEMNDLPNVAVRFSSDSINGEFDSRHGSVIIPDANSVPEGVKVCESYSRGGKCANCSDCWDKSIKVIGYVQHGLKMKKVWRLQVA
jgi:hypothetical protein